MLTLDWIELLRDHGGWRTAAGWTNDPTVGLKFSRSVLYRVVVEGRTFFGTPQATVTRSSLKNVESVVGSPIVGSTGEVLGFGNGPADNTRPAVLG